ncbi:MAG TPA: restriction endonuclease subunit R, partial [Ruminiclostridium sp.]|nr:restriction endonuclease subunit R [Ruminiclostridium sp.]
VCLKAVPKDESLILVATGQKIGEGFDFPRLDVQMLAAPVSFEGRLEQHVGRLNRDYEGKEAVYVYDYIDSHIRYFDNMYAKRLRTYRKTGFTLWTGEEATKQIANAIYDSDNYVEVFEQDLVEADKKIVISSPEIIPDKIERLIFLVKSRQEAGARVVVITREPENVSYGNPNVCNELVEKLKLAGIIVKFKEEVEEHFAVIDDELVWHGGMNLLGKEDAWDNLMRIKSHHVAAELLEIA